MGRARENEQLKLELLSLQDQYKQLDEKYKAALARKKAVENDMKTIKDDLSSKIKVLLGKTENDDKLINMLKAELTKKQSGQKPTSTMIKLDGSETLYDLKNENAKLRNDVMVQETEVMMRDKKIRELEELCVSLAGNPDDRLEEKEQKIQELEEQLYKLSK